MAQVTDFQKIAEEYANQIARERNTRVAWVCLDGSNSALRHHRSKKLSYTVGKPRFDWAPPSLKPDLMVHQMLENGGSQIVTTNIQKAETRKDVYKTSITTGISLGYAVEAKFGLKFAGGSVTKNIEFNFSHTYAWENEVERSWSISQEVPQSPRSSTEVEWFLDKESAMGSYRVDIAISGSIAIWFQDRIEWLNGANKHNLWFQSPGVVVSAMRPAGMEADGFRANFRATGNIEAEVGMRSRLRLIERPMKSTDADAEPNVIEHKLDSDGNALRA